MSTPERTDKTPHDDGTERLVVKRHDVLASLVRDVLQQIRERRTALMGRANKEQPPLSAAPIGSESSSLAATNSKRTLGTRRWVVAITFVSLLLPVAAVMLESARERTLPVQVLGEWRSASPRYADRFIRLSEESVSFGVGVAGPSVEFRIHGVRKQFRGDTIDFEVRYEEGDGFTALAFTFVNGRLPAVYLPNPEGVPWTRQRDVERQRY